ncbi:MAG: PTS glucose transporter subunit IIA, partial [Lachnospiraceae bacterium]|nr:PTS glucose transporter subunit IIA [Lachnospiraceae bacterium]
MFSLFKKEKLEPVTCNANEFVAPADGRIIDITTVSDAVFAEKMLGESIAFEFSGNEVTVCAPCSGNLTTAFPTGHAFGITMANGVETLVHIGVNTVGAKGDGFKMLDKQQGDDVKAGDPIVKVNLKTLKNSYDMSTMLIVTEPNGL